MTAPTRVYLTFDIECAEERRQGGRVVPPQDYDLRIWGRFANQRRPLGIPFVMDELERCDLRGTFYTEMLGAAFFGEPGLREVCETLVARGHDVQLHTHPLQREAACLSRPTSIRSDRMADYDAAEQTALLEEAKRIAVRCGVPARDLVSFRAGHFAGSDATLEAMAAVGLLVDSSYNVSYLDRGCAIRWPRPEIALFDTGRRVHELPVSAFADGNGRYRHLQITAVSSDEVQHYLWQARARGIGEVTIVSHSFEFFFTDSVEKRLGRPNHVNRARLGNLCRFLAAHRAEFQVETVRALAHRLPAASLPSISPEVPRGRRRHHVRRLVEQAAKRLDGALSIPWVRTWT